ncbi:MAG TPA: hypothetical protein VKM55_30975 [Candidatus Lokiarchaeia archaeon]|nr:hypothetical protein [Candidatus Lokiarchaeia archaeon]
MAQSLDENDAELIRNHPFFQTLAVILKLCNDNYSAATSRNISEMLKEKTFDYGQLLSTLTELHDAFSELVRLLRDESFFHSKALIKERLIKSYHVFLNAFIEPLNTVHDIIMKVESTFPEILGRFLKPISSTIRSKYSLEDEADKPADYVPILVPSYMIESEIFSHKLDYSESFDPEYGPPKIPDKYIAEWNLDCLFQIYSPIKEIISWLRDGINASIELIKPFAEYEKEIIMVLEASVKIIRQWHDQPPALSDQFTELEWRDDFSSRLNLLFDSELSSISREELRNKGRTDILLGLTSKKKIIFEFKRWSYSANPVTQILTKYSTSDDKYGIIIIIADRKQDANASFEKYKEKKIEAAETNMVSDVEQFSFESNSNEIVHKSKHIDNGGKEMVIFHLFFNKFKFWG